MRPTQSGWRQGGVHDRGWQIGGQRTGGEDAERGDQRRADAESGRIEWIAPDDSEPGAKGGEREPDGPNRRVRNKNSPAGSRPTEVADGPERRNGQRRNKERRRRRGAAQPPHGERDAAERRRHDQNGGFEDRQRGCSHGSGNEPR